MQSPWRAPLHRLDLPEFTYRVVSFFREAIRNTSLGGVDAYAYASLIKACNGVVGLKVGKSIHAHVIRLGLDCNTNISNALIHFYLSTKSFACYSSVLFERMRTRTVVSLNCMLSGLGKIKELDSGLVLFKRFLAGDFGSGMKPNYITLMVLISGCVETGKDSSQVGNLLHGYCCKTGLDMILEVCNALINFYAKIGYMAGAEKLFDAMAERDLVSCNTMIAAYGRIGNSTKAFPLFRRMRFENVGYDRVSLVNLILACANGRDLDVGKMVHGLMRVNGEEIDVSLGSVLISMYSKCGLIEYARKVFNGLPDENIASWNSMIHGYVDCGCNSEAMGLFSLMKSKKLEPNEVTMLGLISACRNSGELTHGIDIHSHIESSDHLDGNTVLQNALLDMYAKCGSMDRAKAVFDKITMKDVISWTSIIVGHAFNGEGQEAFLAFSQMCAEKVEPNHVTFIGVLSACNHSGLTDIGKKFYNIMCTVFNIEPKIEHYGCIVDMLARAGMLEEASKFLEQMPVEPNSVIRRMLINACKIHGDVDIGLSLVGGLAERETSQSAENHVASSNIYATAGKWDDVLRARRMMVAQKVPKMAGKSFIGESAD